VLRHPKQVLDYSDIADDFRCAFRELAQRCLEFRGSS
jgi:hypothetical protein